MVLTVQQRVFIVECYVKTKSWKECDRLFVDKFKGVKVPAKRSMQQIVAKWRETGSVLNKTKNIPKRVRTPENVDIIRQKIAQSPDKSTRRLSQETGISRQSCMRILHQDLQMRPYKVSVVHELKSADAPQRFEFCNWLFNEIVMNGLDLDFFFMSDEAWFHLNGYVNSQNNRFWASENPYHFHQTPLHDQKVGVWCAVSACRIIGPIFFHHTVNSQRYISAILNPFLAELTEDEKTYGYFQQDGATAHTAPTSLEHIYKIFTPDRVVSRGQSCIDPSWPPRSPDLTVCDYFLWGTLKNKVYQNNPHTLKELQQNISDEIAAIPKAQLRSAFNSLLTRAQKCQEMNGGHFQHLL